MEPGKFCSRAIAYLKADVTSKPGRSEVELSEPDCPVLRELNNGLLVSYVVDTGNEFTYVQNRHLAQEKITPDELHAIGIGNLVSEAGSRGIQVSTHPNGEMFAVLMGGNFEASLILVDALWDEGFRQFVSGDYVVAVPARDILAFCDAGSAAGLKELRALCQRGESYDHPISNRLYRRRGSTWTVLTEQRR
jgi:hypothetical protein